MGIVAQNPLTWAIILTFFHVAGWASSIFRLVYRFKIRRLWWDDWLVFAAFLFDIMIFTAYWARTEVNNPQHSTHIRLIWYWVSTTAYYPVIWLSRMSLAMSLSRLISPDSKWKKVPIIMAIAFLIMGLALQLQSTIICATNTAWHKTATVQCSFKSWISGITCDVLADVSLIVVPILMLWRIRIAKYQRRLVITVFCASILTCLMSIVVYTFLLNSSKWGNNALRIVLPLSQMQVVFSLIVANLLVIVAFIYSKVKGLKDVELDGQGQGDGTDWYDTTMKTRADISGFEMRSSNEKEAI